MAKPEIPGFLPERRTSLVLRSAQTQPVPTFLCCGQERRAAPLCDDLIPPSNIPFPRMGSGKADKVSAYLHGIRVSRLL